MKSFYLPLVLVGCALSVARCAVAQAPAPPPLEVIAPGVFQIGMVQLDKTNKSVQFPAVLNMNHGLIEYLLVTTKGKTHESLLKTDAEPYHIHVAMLLLGAKGAAQTKELLQAPTEQFHANTKGGTNSLANLLKGDRISIRLAWKDAQGEKAVAAEDCVDDLQTGKKVARRAWNYNGSRVVNGLYMAQREGSIVAMIDDVDAMVNNPRPGHDNDQVWQIRTNGLPPLNTPVRVTLQLEK
jgi:hypothetical protein